MSLVMNFGMSTGFAPVDLVNLAPLMPAVMRFDYVRIYQDPSAPTPQSVTCDPPGMETTSYIAKHLEAYTNTNKTHWYVVHAKELYTY